MVIPDTKLNKVTCHRPFVVMTPTGYHKYSSERKRKMMKSTKFYRIRQKSVTIILHINVAYFTLAKFKQLIKSINCICIASLFWGDIENT